jgi:glutathione S-transferase
MLLGALGLECELIEVDIFAGETLTDDFERLNPLRETPVLELDDGSALAQSSAILQYLADGNAWAGGSRLERAQVVAWCCFEQERIMPGLGGARFRLSTGRATPREVAERVAVGLSGLDVLEARLTSEMWLVGTAPTVADLALYPYTTAAGGAGVDLSRWPGITRWTERVVGLPGVVDDWVPYPDNARPWRGRSIYH